MEKTLIRQNAQWNGKMFDHLCPRDIMDNLLKKKTMRHVQILWCTSLWQIYCLQTIN